MASVCASADEANGPQKWWERKTILSVLGKTVTFQGLFLLNFGRVNHRINFQEIGPTGPTFHGPRKNLGM